MNDTFEKFIKIREEIFPMVNYITVSVAEPLIEKIDKVLDEKKTTYRSRADFIQDSIRIRLRELGHNI